MKRISKLLLTFVAASGILILAGCSLSPKQSVPVPPIQEMLTNTSFEDVEDVVISDIDEEEYQIQRPIGYNVKQFHSAQPPRLLKDYFRVDDEVARTGTRSVWIRGGGGSSRIAVMRTMPIDGGETYRFTVWYRSEPRTVWEQPPRYIRPRLQIWAGGSEVEWDLDWFNDIASETTAELNDSRHALYLYSTRQGVQDDGWYPLEATFTLPEEVTQIQIALFNWYGSPAVWYDDISLEKLPR